MLSTPSSAYRFCRSLGLSPEQCAKLTESRGVFEYFVECLKEMGLVV